MIPKPITAAAVGDIYGFPAADSHRREPWYSLARMAPQFDGVVPPYHSPAQWEMRQCRNLYGVFQEFFGTRRLIVDINRCIFRPPVLLPLGRKLSGLEPWY